jgi:hypothetical protein
MAAIHCSDAVLPAHHLQGDDLAQRGQQACAEGRAGKSSARARVQSAHQSACQS